MSQSRRLPLAVGQAAQGRFPPVAVARRERWLLGKQFEQNQTQSIDVALRVGLPLAAQKRFQLFGRHVRKSATQERPLSARESVVGQVEIENQRLAVFRKQN